MRYPCLLLLAASLLTFGCDGESTGTDAGGMDASADTQDGGGGAEDTGPAEADAATDDGGAKDEDASMSDTDAGEAADAAPGDAGALDDASVADASTETDGGLDCTDVGCAAPVVCGESCSAACGCCDCEGPGFCGGGMAWNCAGGCYVQTRCGDTDCAVEDGTASCGSCSALEAQYMALTTGDATMCGGAGGADSCQVLSGHCGVGLGGCYYGVNGGTTQAQLDAISAQWVARGCDAGRPVCRCAAPPTVRCDAGGCLLRGSPTDA